MCTINDLLCDESSIESAHLVSEADIAVEGLYNFAFRSAADVQASLSLADVIQITYRSSGLLIHGYLALPKGRTASKKLPLILFNRGGNNWGDIDDSPYPPRKRGRLTHADAVFALGRIASWGYIVAASQYRGCYDSDQKDEFGGADLDDVVRLREILLPAADVDCERVGSVGYSRGGLMSYLLAAKYGWLKAVATVGACTDLAEFWNNDSPETRSKSPLLLIPQLSADLACLLLHGEADTSCPPKIHFGPFAKLLAQQCRNVTVQTFPHGTHYLEGQDDQAAALTRDWLDRFVANA